MYRSIRSAAFVLMCAMASVTTGSAYAKDEMSPMPAADGTMKGAVMQHDGMHDDGMSMRTRMIPVADMPSADDDGLPPRLAGVVATVDEPSWINTLEFGQQGTDSARPRMTGLLTDNRPSLNSALNVRQSSSESAQPGNGFIARHM